MMRRKAIPILVVGLLAVALGVAATGEVVHRVGESAGWTIIGDVNYTAWSSSRDFHVGDTLLFVYNKQFHNVLEVTKSDYRACNATSPVATYSSGNDSIKVKRKGHTFFICGFPGHCQLGQKVDIRVPKLGAAAAVGGVSAAPSPAPTPASGAREGGMAQNGGSFFGCSCLMVVATTMISVVVLLL